MATAKRKNNFGKMLGLKDKTMESPQVINTFGFDKEIYKDVYTHSQPIRESVKKGDEIIRTYNELGQDLFMGLFKHKPNLLENEDIKDTHQFNRKIMDELMQTDEFRKLRSKTRLDMVNSALGFEIISNEATNMLIKYQEEMKEKGEQSVVDTINDMIDNGQGGGGGKSGKKSGMSAQQAQNLANQMNQAQVQVDQNAMQQAVDQMKQQLQHAAAEALDQVNEIDDMLQQWGMGGGNPNLRIPYEEKKRALQRLRKSDKLKKLSDLIGRMKRIAINEKKQKIPEGIDSIKSVKLGDDLHSILPSEMATLASSNPLVKKQFYQKYTQKELLMYDKDSYKTTGKGAMIVSIDCSGSMNGEPERWSKAVALALLEVSQQQKRHYAAIHFDDKVTGEWEIPYGELRPDAVFDIAEKFSAGGTNFEKPLRQSLGIMQKSQFKKGDIVFITDGSCSVPDNFLQYFMEEKKRLQFKVISILINIGGYGGNSDATLKLFSDKIITISDIAKMGDNTAAEIFRDVQP